jgi:AcrR family transcriptional regulator
VARSGRQAQHSDARSEAMRLALTEACIASLTEVGAAGTSAREVARRAGVNQALVFYHFGSVHALLLAALDRVSEERLAAYGKVIAEAKDVPAMIGQAQRILTQDLDRNHVTVLVELVAAARGDAEMLSQVNARLAPWKVIAENAVRRALPTGWLARRLAPRPEVAAHAVVAGLLGLELLATIEGDRDPALHVLDESQRLVGAFARLSISPRKGRHGQG